MLIFIFLVSLLNAQYSIETKEYKIYKKTDSDMIELNQYIKNINGKYEVSGVNISNISFTKEKKVIIEFCELEFKIFSDLDDDPMKISKCSDVINIKNILHIDEINNSFTIHSPKYNLLEFEITFWITGKFNNVNKTNKINNNGIMNEWYDNGNMSIEYKFKYGKKHGVQKRWHENNQLEILYNYFEGKLDGTQKSWYENGILTGEWNYLNDTQHGLSKEWYINGQMRHSKLFDNGILINILESYDNSGNVN